MVGQYVVCSKGVGTIQRNLYWPHLKRVLTLVPPLPEQSAIVRYLDHADRRIRRYVGAKQKLIALLEEETEACHTTRPSQAALNTRTSQA